MTLKISPIKRQANHLFAVGRGMGIFRRTVSTGNLVGLARVLVSQEISVENQSD